MGPAGPTGAAGATGAQGPAGPQGAQGTTGSQGATGASGAESRVLLSTEPPGSNCVDGGTKVQVGVDTNGNGALDASEVQQTAYVCNGTSSGPDGGAPTGTVAIGQACSTTGDCIAGATCVDLTTGTGVCSFPCTQDSQCAPYGTSNNPSFCAVQTTQVQGMFCTTPCTPGSNAGCPSGLDCFTELATVGTPAVEAELTFCAVAGPVRAGGNCSGGEACGPGLTCATDSSGTVCSPVCLLDAGTCPSSTCQSLGAVEGAVSYGFCPTAPTARNGQPCSSES